MKAILAVTAILACVGVWYSMTQQAGVSTNPVEEMFLKFLTQHGKSYNDVMEYKMRLTTFSDSIDRINKLASNGINHEVGLNHFADWTDEEFNGMMGYKSMEHNKAPVRLAKTTNPGPNSQNWIEQGCVNAIKDQGACGSCYSFSAISSIETEHCIKTGELVSFSEKDCMDCSFREGNHGCGGGHMISCWEYFEKSQKICTEEEYPYKPKYEVCKEKNCATPFEAPVTDYHRVAPKDAAELMAALDQGAVSIAIQANKDIFRYYKSGVLLDDPKAEDEEKCGTSLNHAVVAVGYSYDGDMASADNYILVRNSWSTKWGDEGYVKIGFGNIKYGGTCGLFMDPSFPDTN